MRILVEREGRKHIEVQELARKGDLLKNALNYGYTLSQVEELEVGVDISREEYQAIYKRDVVDKNRAIRKVLREERAKKQKVKAAPLFAKMGLDINALTDREFLQLTESLR